MGEKSEKATPKKLKDARKKGQVAKSQDFPSAFTFLVAVGAVLGMSGSLYERLTGFIVLAFNQITADDVPAMLLALFAQALTTILLASLPILVMVVLVGVIINFLMVGPGLSLEAFKPDIKKFNPINNLKAKFKMKTLVELLKNLAKIAIAGFIIYLVMWNSLPVLTTAVGMPILGALALFYHFLMEVLFKIGLIFMVIAIADLIYQKKVFAKEMKMEKFEVKQEYKNQEGDPQIKGKRREIARELAYGGGPGSTIKYARFLVTNPTHIAVAIGYDRDEDPAPYIMEMGEDNFAQLMMKEAEKHDIPIMRNIPLARTLYEEGEVWAFVPRKTYEALAEILRWIESLNREAEPVET